MRKNKPIPGLTLIEIMAVLVVLAIASAIVLPQIGNHDDLKVASAARQLVAHLLYAQGRAIATGKMVFVRFDPPRGAYQLLDSIDPPKLIDDPASRLPFEIDLNAGPLKGVTFKSASFDGRDVLAFDATGRPCSSDGSTAMPLPMDRGSIVIASGDAAQTVSIQPVTGAISVRD